MCLWRYFLTPVIISLSFHSLYIYSLTETYPHQWLHLNTTLYAHNFIRIFPKKSPTTEPSTFFSRRFNGKLSLKRASLSQSNGKRANLCARKKERVKLPNYGDGVGRNSISEFFSHPSGIEAILNTKALQSYESLDSNLYRCVLPQIRLLNFRVAPVLDLLVTPSDEDCKVEMLSCKFDGSEVVQRQNERFSASMRNHIKWETIGAELVMDVDVELSLILEITTQPFTSLPISAVEGPGNMVMQALVDQLVPLLVKQLLQDYEKWINQQRKSLA